jgi:predicted small secreted protein
VKKLLILILALVVLKALLLMLASCAPAAGPGQPVDFGAGFRMDEAVAAGGG